MGAIEVHHQVPRYLLRLFDWKTDDPVYEEEFVREAALYSIEAGISREDIEDLIESSTVEIPREQHRGVEHAGDWSRWGARSGATTFERYGAGWFALLARRRWKRIRVEMLQEYRAQFRKEAA